MSKQVKHRRGTATEHNSFTGVIGEVTVDTTNYSLRVHDGSTVGGRALARADGVNTSGTWPIAISGIAATATFAVTAGTANALNIANGYTVAALNCTGLVYAVTPNAGTSGGFILRANAETGNAIFQVQGSGGSSQFGYFIVTSAGTFTWSGAMAATQFNGAGTGLTGTAGSLSIGGNAATATYATSAGSATNATSAANATNATNATKLATTNFTVEQSGSDLLFKYNGTTVAKLSSAGVFSAASNISAYGIV